MKKKSYLSTRTFFVLMLHIAFIIVLLTVILIYSIRAENFWVFTLLLLLELSLLYFTYRFLILPTKETNKTLTLFSKGYILKGIYDIRVPYSPELAEALKKFEELLDTKELISNTKKHAEYLALQNQINPHFLYNTLEGIRSEALIEGIPVVAEMTEALSTYFRYTISNVEKLVTLEDELTNIENYYKIQQFRFGDRLSLSLVYDSEEKERILQCKLPKLTLQPIVENAIFHGMERKIGKGNLRIKVVDTKERLIITVSDDGIGMDKEKLVEINEKLNGTTLEYMKEDYDKSGGIALINVNNRIKLIFGDEYGIYVYSQKNAGTDVEITLPIFEAEI